MFPPKRFHQNGLTIFLYKVNQITQSRVTNILADRNLDTLVVGAACGEVFSITGFLHPWLGFKTKQLVLVFF